MNTSATVTRALGAAYPCATPNTGTSAGEVTATFSFNFAPHAYVLAVTRPDGSVVRHVTIEEGAVEQPPATGPNARPHLPSHRLDRTRHRRRRADLAASTP